jgi:hypothetical protein
MNQIIELFYCNRLTSIEFLFSLINKSIKYKYEVSLTYELLLCNT